MVRICPICGRACGKDVVQCLTEKYKSLLIKIEDLEKRIKTLEHGHVYPEYLHTKVFDGE